MAKQIKVNPVGGKQVTGAGSPISRPAGHYPSNLLVVFDDALSSSYLFEKAALLAGPDTRVHVVQVIYEGIADISVSAIDHSAGLKSFLLESAESMLEEQLFKFRDRFPGLESATLWNSRDWEGVMHAAEAVNADLILKAADEHQISGISRIIRTPSEWNLLRHATVPVMIVKPQAWSGSAVLLCALDVFDDSHEGLNLRLLERAADLSARLGVDLDLVCAYPLFEPWVGELGAVQSYEEIKGAVEQDIRERVEKLVGRSKVRYRHLLLDEGQAAQVIVRVAEETDAALLILGTHAREGVLGVLLGNTSERILHAVATDVLTVPVQPAGKRAKRKKRAAKARSARKQAKAKKSGVKKAGKEKAPKKKTAKKQAAKKKTAKKKTAKSPAARKAAAKNVASKKKATRKSASTGKSARKKAVVARRPQKKR